MKEKIKNIFSSPLFTTGLSKAIGILFALVCIVAIFWTGEFVGFKRAQFSYRYGENYSKIFGQRDGMMGGMPGPDGSGFPNVHGATGKIISINLPSMVIADQNGMEKIITIQNDSTIRRSRDLATSSNLRVGDVVTVLGVPNENGWIVAKLIRIMSPVTGTTSAAIIK